MTDLKDAAAAMTNGPKKNSARDNAAVKLLALLVAAALVVYLSQEFSRHGGRVEPPHRR